MDSSALDQAIYERYLIPTQRPKTRKVGLEFELPIVNRKTAPTDFAAVHQMTEAFLTQFSFRETARDDDGYIYAAQNDQTGDGLSFDCSYNTLEFSFGTELDLHTVYKRFAEYYTFVQEELGKYDHALTGMGINPRHTVNHNIPVASERYRMLFHHLSSYEKYGQAIPFHRHPNFGMFSCASQIQVDVEEKDLAQTLNTFTKLEPLKALLFSNSPWLETGDILCIRDNLWRNSLHGLNRHNVDMYALEFDYPADVVSYIRSMSLYCVEREGKYINFAPLPLEEYFSAESVTGEYFDGQRYQTIRFQPEISDLSHLRSFKFADLTFRGTVEFRSVCEQPVQDIMTTAAFHAGLVEVLPALTGLLNQDHVVYHKGYNPSELRRLFVKRYWPEVFERKELSALLIRILNLAREGLMLRGRNEEVFLAPLYQRAERLQNPALEMITGLEEGKSIEDYIEAYGRLAG